MYAVPKRECVIGAGPRVIHRVYMPNNKETSLKELLASGVITNSQFLFLNRRQIRIVCVGVVFDLQHNGSLGEYEIWADLTQRDETAYALLTV